MKTRMATIQEYGEAIRQMLAGAMPEEIDGHLFISVPSGTKVEVTPMEVSAIVHHLGQEDKPIWDTYRVKEPN